jgi:hypothetical protein
MPIYAANQRPDHTRFLKIKVCLRSKKAAMQVHCSMISKVTKRNGQPGPTLNAQKGTLNHQDSTAVPMLKGYRIIYGLIEADCWWAGYLSTSPIIRSEDVRVFPTAPENLYQAESFTKWLSLIDRGARTHTGYHCLPRSESRRPTWNRGLRVELVDIDLPTHV